MNLGGKYEHVIGLDSNHLGDLNLTFHAVHEKLASVGELNMIHVDYSCSMK